MAQDNPANATAIKSLTMKDALDAMRVAGYHVSPSAIPHKTPTGTSIFSMWFMEKLELSVTRTTCKLCGSVSENPGNVAVVVRHLAPECGGLQSTTVQRYPLEQVLLRFASAFNCTPEDAARLHMPKLERKVRYLDKSTPVCGDCFAAPIREADVARELKLPRNGPQLSHPHFLPHASTYAPRREDTSYTQTAAAVHIAMSATHGDGGKRKASNKDAKRKSLAERASAKARPATMDDLESFG